MCTLPRFQPQPLRTMRGSICAGRGSVGCKVKPFLQGALLCINLRSIKSAGISELPGKTNHVIKVNETRVAVWRKTVGQDRKCDVPCNLRVEGNALEQH